LQEEETVAGFLHAIGNSADIDRCYDEGKYTDLVQVQGDLSLIREWFTNGLDEVAAVFGLFENVCKTGSYQIMSDTPQARPHLALRCKHDQREKTIRGKELTRFVQHVSLIQHEDVDVASEVACFVEQYQKLAKAADIRARLLELGVGINTESFTSSVGRTFMGHSRSLLNASEVALKESEAKLRQLTELYPASLLFSIKELRKIYELLVAVLSGDVGGWGDVARMTSRLISSALDPADFEDFARTVQNTASSVREFLSPGEESWLHQASKFVDDLLREAGNESLRPSVCGEQDSRIVVHTVALEDHLVGGAIFDLLRIIYKVIRIYACRLLGLNSDAFPATIGDLAFFSPFRRIDDQGNSKFWMRWVAALPICWIYFYAARSVLQPTPL